MVTEDKNRRPEMLRRELGLGDAVAVGLGAVIGAGIFVVSGVAAGIAGPAMLISLLIAGAAASFNGLSSAMLAARFPYAGGTYEYGYEMLHPLAGFSAGWLFLISKLTAGGVVALGFGSYMQQFFPALDVRWTATAALLFLVIANLAGIKKAGLLNRIIVSITVLSLIYFIFSGFAVFDAGNFQPFFASSGWGGVAQASGVLFFAFTGYARIATLGEEVDEPQKNIPRAIIITLISSVILYSLVSLVALGAIGAEGMSESGTPLFSAAEAMTWPAVLQIIMISGTTALLGVLLSQILGTSRMFYAMGQRRDLPHLLSHVSKGSGVPTYGILLSGLVILLAIWTGELTFITQTASFTILIYYSIANLSAMRLEDEDHFLPRWIPWAGLILCILMAFSLPLPSILAGLSLLLAGHLLRLVFRAYSQPSP